MATLTAYIFGDAEHEDTELTVIGTVGSCSDVEIESIRDEHGVEIDATKAEIARAEQALIDAHVAREEGRYEDAMDARGDYMRDSAIDRELEEAR